MGLLEGTLRDYHRDPFPHSLLRTRELSVEGSPHWMPSQSLLGGAAAVTVRSKIARAFGVLQGFQGLVYLSRFPKP